MLNETIKAIRKSKGLSQEEPVQICKSLGLEHDGTKQRLNHVIEAYFQGRRIDPTPPRKAIRGQGA